MKFVVQLLALSAFVFVADFVWLGIIMKGFYHQELGQLLRQGPQGFAPRIIPALLVYGLIPAGLILFVGPRIDPRNSIFLAAGWGAAFGLIVYGIYDLTNLAILEKWPLSVTVADMIWGTCLCGASAMCLHAIDGVWARSASPAG